MLCVSERSCALSLQRAWRLLWLRQRDEGAATSSTTLRLLHLHLLLLRRPTRSLIDVGRRSSFCSAFAPKRMRKQQQRMERGLRWMCC
jgi:hypothetical protein